MDAQGISIEHVYNPNKQAHFFLIYLTNFLNIIIINNLYYDKLNLFMDQSQLLYYNQLVPLHFFLIYLTNFLNRIILISTSIVIRISVFLINLNCFIIIN